MHDIVTIAPAPAESMPWFAATTATNKFMAAHFRGYVKRDGGPCGNNPQMRVMMPDLFPATRPWKSSAIQFQDPRTRSPYKPPIRVSVTESSVARARAEAILQAAYRAAKPRPTEVKPAWRTPLSTEPVDSVTQLEMSYDGELNDERRVDKKYVTKGILGHTLPTERRISSVLDVEIARWQGAYSQIKYDAGPFWLKRGRYFGLEERKQYSWRHSDSTKWPETLRRAAYIDRQYTDPTETGLIAAFSHMLYRSEEINKKVEACNAEGEACRSYQAGALFRTYYLSGRRVSTTNIICADIVVEAIHGHLRRGGKIDWTARTAILDMLEGASDRATGEKFGLHHKSLQERYNTETAAIEAKFGRYCSEIRQPRQKPSTSCYTGTVSKNRKSASKSREMSRAELITDYRGKAKPTYSWLDDDFMAWLRRMYRTGALRIIIKYLNLRALPFGAYSAIAEYLARGGANQEGQSRPLRRRTVPQGWTQRPASHDRTLRRYSRTGPVRNIRKAKTASS